MYSKGVTTEVAAQGIRVNTVTPGNVATPGADQVRADITDAFGLTALGIGAPVDIAGETPTP